MGKSLRAFLNEVHFINSLYSFPLHFVPRGKQCLPQGKFFAYLPGKTTSGTASFFLLTTVSWGCLNYQVRVNIMVNILDYHSCRWRLASRIHPSISLKTAETFVSFQNGCWVFSQNFIFHHSKLAFRFLVSRPRQKKITHFPRQHSFENLFPQQ